VPIEFRQVPCGDPERTAASFAELQRDLAALRELQQQRGSEYRRLPGAETCMAQVLASS
jgi:hypothetical protein